MAESEKKTIWTIGHSTRAIEDFMAMLKSFEIELVADIRRYPGSKRYPQFNKESLEVFLNTSGISYIHMPELGGRRKARPDSTNPAWKNAAFRGYADYMETDEFKISAGKLEALAEAQKTVYMCAEAVWWSCHRALVSDYLKAKGWKVMHIMDVYKATEHPYTAPAREAQGGLFY